VLGATAKPKIGCANLVRTTERAPRQMSGQAVPMPGVVETGLTGSAVMARKLTGVTTISVVASGLVPDAPYVAHLHDLPCEVAQGGGHYKRDPDAATTNVTNEVWFALVADADGAAYDSTWTDHVTSADAASLVLHAEGGARVGCFDLR